MGEQDHSPRFDPIAFKWDVPAGSQMPPVKLASEDPRLDPESLSEVGLPPGSDGGHIWGTQGKVGSTCSQDPIEALCVEPRWLSKRPGL